MAETPMGDYVDLARIVELEGVVGTDAPAIVSSILDTMIIAIDEVEDALARKDLDRAGRAAHRCRNDALMIGARQLLNALTELEIATRNYHPVRAVAALEDVRVVWPPTRDELAAGANPP